MLREKQSDALGKNCMSDQEIYITSLIKMKYLTWFTRYKLIDTRRTPEYSTFGAIKYKTAWRLAKPKSR